MSSSLKRAAAQSLVDYFKNVIPPTFGIHYGVDHAEPEDKLCFPSIRVIPGSFSFVPWQDQYLDETLADRALVEVGTFEGMMEIRLSTKSQAKAELIEDFIINAFLATELAPGIVVTQTPQVTILDWLTTYQANISFALDKMDWQDELSYTKKQFTFLELECWFPALVMRTDQFRIDNLIQAFNHDLASDAVEEQQEVAEDGSTSISIL